eukprot:2112592-Pyramimonas_sp.AAC.1
MVGRARRTSKLSVRRLSAMPSLGARGCRLLREPAGALGSKQLFSASYRLSSPRSRRWAARGASSQSRRQSQ